MENRLLFTGDNKKIVSCYNNISPGNLLKFNTFLGTINMNEIKGVEMYVRNIQ